MIGSVGRIPIVSSEPRVISPWGLAAAGAIGLLLFSFPLASALPHAWQQAFWRTGFYRVGAILATSAVLFGLAAVFVKPRSRASIAVGISTAVLGSAWLAIALWIGQMMRGYFNG